MGLRVPNDTLLAMADAACASWSESDSYDAGYFEAWDAATYAVKSTPGATLHWEEAADVAGVAAFVRCDYTQYLR